MNSADTVLHISPKPTVFKGIRYRSRLEATWAVFYDQLVCRGYINDVKYEQWADDHDKWYGDLLDASLIYDENARTFARKYRPDFMIRDGDYVLYQEVKPIFPNTEYLHGLRAVAQVIGLASYALILSVGSFRDENPPANLPYPYILDLRTRYLGLSWLPDCVSDCANYAREFRWDLVRQE